MTPKQRTKRIAELTHCLNAAKANKEFSERQVVLFDGDETMFRAEIDRLRGEPSD